MTTKHKHYDLIVAWAEGAKIQVLSEDSDEEWLVLEGTPNWFVHRTYRIAPKPKVKKWRWVFKTSTGVLNITEKHYKEGSLAHTFPNLAVVQKINSTMIEEEDCS